MSHRSILGALSLAVVFPASVAVADPVEPLPEVCEIVPAFTPSFAPVLEWEWTGSPIMATHNQVMMAPIVLDVSGDGTPDVIFHTFQGSNYNTNGVMRAIDGATGADLWAQTDPAYRVRGASSIAGGDIDGDGLPELCTVRESTQVACFEHDGTFKFNLPGATNSWGGPSLADLDGDGAVEVINGNTVHAGATGALLWTGSDGLGGAGGTGPISFAADIDVDGTLEVVNDRAIYRANGALHCVNTAIPHGLAGVGNFDADDQGEVVIVASGFVRLMDDNCALLWSAPIPGGGHGGAPNIADFDGDGAAEVGVAGASRYVVIDTNGALLWQQVVQDLSNRTGSSTFDFEGDGSAEVVYADERRLRIYDGATGTVRFDVPHASGTTYENPLIVDVDADGNAEIIVAANNYAFAGPTGIRAWRDAADGWVNTRGIWNQHAYSITNVEDDGTIPAAPDVNWLTPGLNTFRSNSQGTGTTTPFAAPDLTVEGVVGTCVPDSYLVTLSAHVHNQGDAPASAGVSVSFYLGDPDAGGTLLTTTAIPATVGPLESVEVDVVLVAPGGAGLVYARVDDDGAGVGGEAECDETNNAGSGLVDLSCSPNDPPVADCTDLIFAANDQCLADGSVDNGSYDPDGDPITITETPAGPFGLGTTTVDLTVCDDGGLCDTCQGSVTVVDLTPPTVVCNTPATIRPSDAPIAFTATGIDNCDVDVEVSDLTCTAVNGAGRVIDKSGSCVVDLTGATASVIDAGGVGTTIGWVASATDGSGNGVSLACSVTVVNPGNGSGCNQGLGNGAEGCDPGNSNHNQPTNDESGGTPGKGGRKK